MSSHFLRLAGAATLVTRQFALAQLNLDAIVRERAIGLYCGDAGLGKSFAVEAGLTRMDLPVHWLDLPHGVTQKQLVQQLLRAVTGIHHTGTMTDLEHALLDELADGPALIVVDEAQHLHFRAVEHLRHLWDHRETQIAIALVGGNGCASLIDRYPALRSRIWRITRFRPLTVPEVMAWIPDFHPLYQDAQRALIARIDRDFAYGVLRNWASFTKSAQALMAQEGLTTLTDVVIENVLALQAGDLDAA